MSGSLRQLRLPVPLLLVALAGCLAATPSAAQLSPGPLSEAHRELEGSSNCLECHSAGRGVDPELCLSCHGVLAERIEQGTGLHAQPEYADCKSCHIEHHGREFELVWWGEEGIEAFDHRLAGWPLEGAHQRLGCRDCHREENNPAARRLRAVGKDPARSFLGLASECLACHQDEHRDQFAGEGCLSCHQIEAWRPATGFDHSEARFSLTGAHQPLGCELCHPRVADPGSGDPFTQFRGLPFSSCADCHDDPHSGRLGADCASCHVTDSWGAVRTSAFDHDLTAYPLRGRHREVRCESCHRTGSVLRAVAHDRCIDCHVDPHEAQFAERPDGGACESCHTVEGFVPSLFGVGEHASVFPLEGPHEGVPCLSCHGPTVRDGTVYAEPFEGGATPGGGRLVRFRFASLECLSCHRDPHEGSARVAEIALSCESCHVGNIWSRVEFQHAETGFTLDGAHDALGCQECHRAGVDADESPILLFGGLEVGCEACHQDRHQGQFAEPSGAVVCGRCHVPAAWVPATRFDHTRDARFALEGAHIQVSCGACHRSETFDGIEVVRYRPLASGCSDCHG